jgi:hypothetical protein
MGGCPTGTVPGSFQRGRRKRGLQTDLQTEIVREIETLLGCRSIADLDFEAVEMVARRQALRLAARALEQRLNTDTSACGTATVVAERSSKVHWDLCIYSALITVSNAIVDSVRGTGLWGWNRFR